MAKSWPENEQQLLPARLRFAITVADCDSFLAPIEPHADDHQQALAV
ncbi:hypothetical protein ACFQ3P_42960 [Paraburkholderia sabiae]